VRAAEVVAANIAAAGGPIGSAALAGLRVVDLAGAAQVLALTPAQLRAIRADAGVAVAAAEAARPTRAAAAIVATGLTTAVSGAGR
jgi:hypothetical protein